MATVKLVPLIAVILANSPDTEATAEAQVGVIANYFPKIVSNSPKPF